MNITIVGAGLFGCVMAEQIASQHDVQITIVERRSHIGGNCYSLVDDATGVEYHKYGSHIFHTDRQEIWNYVNRFARFSNYQHRVFTLHKGTVYAMPVNLLSINALYGKTFSPAEARAFVVAEAAREKQTGHASFEEKVLAAIGRPLYEAFFKNYTAKQWGRSPAELWPEMFSRLPLRFTYDNRYFSDPWQGMPLDGYTAMLQAILDQAQHSRPGRIHLLLNTDFRDYRANLPEDELVIYSGNIDAYFDYSLGKLEWRGVSFEIERYNVPDYQGTSVMNYADADVPYTRKHEFRHLHPERTYPDKTIVLTEFPHQATHEEEYSYPIPDAHNATLCKAYKELAAQSPNVIFGGRLGQYAYFDMDDTIMAALACYRNEIKPRFLG